MNTLIKFKQFVDEIRADTGRLYKIDILEKYKDDPDIQAYLNYIYNPYIVTGISDKKLHKVLNIANEGAHEIEDIFVLLDYIRNNNTGSDHVIACCQKVLSQIADSDLANLLEGIITKNIQLGVDVKTINKIIPNLIPEFSVMLANKYFDNPQAVEGKNFVLTTKIDGGRIIAIKKNGAVKFYTRQGQEYEGLVDLEEEMKMYMPDNICLDGEITLLDPWVVDNIGDSLWSDDHSIGRKLTSKEQYKETMKITRKNGEKHGVKMLVFDCMTSDEFENQYCPDIYTDRRKHLDQIFDCTDHTYKYFTKLPVLYEGNDTSMIVKVLNEAISHDEEGIMINLADALYEFKRTSSLLKVKMMKTLDLEIVDYEEGNNSNKGKLGAFIVRYKDGNLIKVGSGYSKELREEVWKDPESYIGRIIEVQYFEETENQNGGKSLRFPVFLSLRFDKDIPDF